jgi:cyclase
MSQRNLRPLMLTAVLSVSVGPATAMAQTLPPQLPQLPAAPLERLAGSPFTVYPTRGNVYMIAGPNGNTTVAIGGAGAIVVDPGTPANSAMLLAEIRRLTDRPVRLLINTSSEAEHIAANRAVAVSGQNLAGGNRRPPIAGATDQAPIWGHEGVLQDLIARGGSSEGWPTDSYFVAQKDMFMNGDAVQLLHVPAAHTGGDSFVSFRRADVISAGDVYTPDRYPVIRIEQGGSINGLIDGLNYLLRMTVPEFNEEGGTLVIPAHGRLSDEADVGNYRDMVTIVRDRIQDMIKKNMTLQQVKAAKPTLDYDVLYGTEAGAVFIEQVYRSLKAAPRAASKGQP